MEICEKKMTSDIFLSFPVNNTKFILWYDATNSHFFQRLTRRHFPC